MAYSYGNKPIVPTINSCRVSSSEASTPSDVLRLQASSPLPPIKENGTSPPSDNYVDKRYLFDSPVPNTSDKYELNKSQCDSDSAWLLENQNLALRRSRRAASV